MSDEGKARASLNRLSHGANAQFLVLPNEDPAECEAAMEGWWQALAPRSLPEAQLATLIADCAWKAERLRRLEHRRQLAVLDERLQKVPEQQALHAAEEASASVAGLVRLISDGGVPQEPVTELSGLFAAMASTVARVRAVDGLPLMAVEAFENAMDTLVQSSKERMSASEYRALGAVAATLLPILSQIITDLEGPVAEARKKISETQILLDDADLKRLARARKVVETSFASYMDMLQRTRQLASSSVEGAEADQEHLVRLRIAH